MIDNIQTLNVLMKAKNMPKLLQFHIDISKPVFLKLSDKINFIHLSITAYHNMVEI